MCTANSIDGITHLKCQKPQGLDGLTTLFPYCGVVRKSLLGMKYKYASDISDSLMRYLTKKIMPNPILDRKFVFIPIPLHKRRKNWRGYNQTEIIGEKLASNHNWEYLDNLLVRKSFREAQTNLHKDDRQENIKGAFDYYRQYVDKSIPLLLFDDVWTTGSTLREAGKVLKRNGHEHVWGLTIAR